MSLKVEKLKVTIQKKEILHGINFEVKQGEFVSLLGPSGCGKTTLLKSIAGLVEVQEGEVWIQGGKGDKYSTRKARHNYRISGSAFISQYDCRKEHCISNGDCRCEKRRTKEKGSRIAGSSAAFWV